MRIVLFVGAAAALLAACGDRSAQDTSPAPVAAPAVHAARIAHIVLPGVHVGPIEVRPGTIQDGPYTFARLDLDEGQRGDAVTGDVELSINARTMSVSMQAPGGAAVGDAREDYSACTQIAEDNSNRLVVGPMVAPTPYICVVTNEGRTSEFRLTAVESAVQLEDPQSVDIDIAFEFTTWESER